MNSSPSRRQFLGLSVAAASAALLTACTSGGQDTATSTASGRTRILPTDRLVSTTENRRPTTGKTVSAALTAAPFTAALAEKKIGTWGYNASLTGPTVRAQTGDTIKVDLRNRLPQPTTIHWHGLALRNDMDGVQGLTQDPVPGGSAFAYQFTAPHPGTYWYHSHIELQRERALSGALIIEDPKDPVTADHEWVIVLDDWLDGITGTPEQAYAAVSAGMGSMGMDSSSSPSGMGGMDHSNVGGMGGMGGSGSTSAPADGKSFMLMGATSDYLGGDAGDVRYPLHLVNGRTPNNPDTLTAAPGDTVRLRIINAAGDTAYRVGIPGQKITLTHTDGYPVEQAQVDAVVLGMGERIDALLTVRDGYTPLLARPEGKSGLALGLIKTGTGKPPIPEALPRTITGTVTDGSRLTAPPSARLAQKKPDVVHRVRLTGSMMAYDWGINGRQFDEKNPFNGAFEVEPGQRVQIDFVNETPMWHPMHLHGHTFQVATSGARKDTVIVRPKETVSIFFDADNPGQWLLHCHNAYHAQKGMMGVLSYVQRQSQ
ncbi:MULTISPECIES: multicopper oxidase family protein [unclassified Tersicoccus]|uniref:multicopper oxidase family protein n=1 Tax=Tersicoccus TaxID=1418588 RepID=UPI000978057B|nr:multicopper oxidase family protein [Tersicoccus sp. Bi-70]OMH36307.1 copper oxidase [Tersicoccus sp. Bi-70]